MTNSKNHNKEKQNKIKDKILHKIHKENVDKSTKESTRDMGEAHSPISCPDLSGLTPEQVKAELAKVIEEKIEKVSMIQLSEMKIDAREKERQREKAAERIDQRRKRRKEKSIDETEAVFTEQGVFSDYRASSVFDIIQPESFCFEEEEKTEPIEEKIEPILGQVSMLEMQESLNAQQLQIIEQPQIVERHQIVEPPQMEEKAVSLAIDSAIDKVFEFLDKTKNKSSVLFNRLVQFVDVKVIKSKVIITLTVKIMSLAPVLVKFISKLTPLAQVLIEKEKKTSAKMSSFINWLDSQNEKLANKCSDLLAIMGDKFDLAREYAEHNKKKLLIGFGAGVAATALVMLTIGSMTAYEYVYNGKVLGVVKSQEDVYKTIDIIGDKLSYAYNAEITIDKEQDITFNKVYAMNQELDDKEDVLNRLTYMKDMKAKGYGIFVNDSLIVVLASKASAKEVLEEMKSKYIKKNEETEYVRVGFAEHVAIEEIDTKLGSIQNKENVMEYMLTGAVEKKIHLVQSGETFSEIAKMYGMKQSELSASNPDVIPEKLSIDQEISLTQAVPVATVQTVEVATYIEDIPYEITYENTGSMYEGEKTVKSKGGDGQKEVVAEIIRNNGIEVGRTELSTKILSNPTAQVVLVGTKKLPPLVGTGKFIYPVRGRLSSGYGTRWGRLHSGIDLAASTGTKIIAADGGKVISAGYKGALGYMVEIDHGGGRVSLYGHCSKLFVKAGEKVYQGQHIANVGNTGRSTGPHLHFEVHINGKTKNPLNYL